MATTTPNFGWPVPSSTDYVKDGASSIETLGDAIDATVFGLGTSAETKIASGTFTGATVVNLSNVLSSTYKYYRFYLSGNVTTSAQTMYMRFRENTTDKATGYYGGRYFVQFNGSSGIAGYNNLTQINMTDFYFTSATLGTVAATITRPDATQGTITSLYYDSSSNGTGFFGAAQNAMTNFTGLSFYPAAQTMTGAYLLTGVK